MDINSLLTSVLSGLSSDAVRYTDAASSIGQAATGMEAANTAAIGQARVDIPAAQNIAQGVADVDYQRNQLVQQQLRDAQLHPEQADNAYTQGLATLTDLNMQRSQAAQEVTNLASTNLLEDPFGYVMAQLNMPVAKARLAGLDTQATQVTQDVQNRLNLAKAAQSTVVADVADKQKALAYKQAELAANAAKSKLEVASAEVQSKVAGEMLRQADTLAKITSGHKDIYSMAAQQDLRNEQRNQWTAASDERAELRELRKTEIAARLADKETKAAAEAESKLRLDAAYAVLGLGEAPELAAFNKSVNTPRKKALSDFINGGNFGHNLQTSLTTFLASEPNIAGIEAGGNAGFSRLAQGLLKTGMASVETVKGKPDALGKLPNMETAIKDGFSTYENLLVGGARDIKNKVPLTSPYWDVNFTPYKADHRRLATHESLLGSNIVAEVAKTIAPTVPTDINGFRGTDDQQIFKTVAAMVNDKKIDINKAADQVAEYFKASAMINRAWYSYELMGLPAQTSYRVQVTVDTPGTFTDTVVPGAGLAADVMNPVDAKRLLLGIITANVPAAYPVRLPGTLGLIGTGLSDAAAKLLGK